MVRPVSIFRRPSRTTINFLVHCLGNGPYSLHYFVKQKRTYPLSTIYVFNHFFNILCFIYPFFIYNPFLSPSPIKYSLSVPAFHSYNLIFYCNIFNLFNNNISRLYHIKNIMSFISKYYCFIIFWIIFC